MVREMRGPKAEPEVNVGGTAGVLNSCPIIGQEFFYYLLTRIAKQFLVSKSSGGGTLARRECVAIATALGASVLRAERFPFVRKLSL